MNSSSRMVHLASCTLVAVGLAGCAAAMPRSEAHAPADMGRMDMQSMCEMHKRMMGGKSPAEQQAMMEDQMKSMTPEMRQRMQAMREQCK